MYFAFIVLILLAGSAKGTPIIESLCTTEANNRYIDISSAKIQKTTTYQYSLTLLDTPINIIKNGSSIIFEGNFSKLTLRNNALKKQFVYYGRQLIFKIQANHIFTRQKISDLQIQIIHSAQNHEKQNPYHFVLLSQLYMISKFQNRIVTVLSKYFNPQSSNGTIVQTSKIIQTFDGFPLLMYKGSAETFPCRQDLLCFVKRQHQLISLQDFDILKSMMLDVQTQKVEKTYFLRKNIYLINTIKKQINDKETINDEL